MGYFTEMEAMKCYTCNMVKLRGRERERKKRRMRM